MENDLDPVPHSYKVRPSRNAEAWHWLCPAVRSPSVALCAAQAGLQLPPFPLCLGIFSAFVMSGGAGGCVWGCREASEPGVLLRGVPRVISTQDSLYSMTARGQVCRSIEQRRESG